MFPALRAALVTSVALVVLACADRAQEAPAAAPATPAPAEPAASAPAEPAGPPFTMELPPLYAPVRAEPPIVAAWETPPMSNGFIPTIRVTREKRVSGSSAEAFAAWRQHFTASLAQTYKEPRVIAERAIEGAGVPAHLVIAVASLPVPGEDKRMPIPLFTFGAIYDVGDSLWVVAGVGSATLDVATAQIRPADEAAIVASITSFRPRVPGKN
jgi:hypothetical protein